MIIVFDLDDTLIDTTGTLTPYLLEKAFSELQKHGLKEKKILDLKKIYLSAPSTMEALETFLKDEKEKEKFLKISQEIIYHSKSFKEKIIPFNGVIKILNILKKNHVLALVSKGLYERQLLKLENAGIDRGFFSIIDIVQSDKKGFAYKKIIDKLQVKSEDVLVCGDRYKNDLLPAIKLGCKTVLVNINSERKKNCVFKMSKEVDYKITHFEELLAIIEKN